MAPAVERDPAARFARAVEQQARPVPGVGRSVGARHRECGAPPPSTGRPPCWQSRTGAWPCVGAVGRRCACLSKTEAARTRAAGRCGACSGTWKARWRLLGVVPAADRRAAIEVWLVRRLRRDLTAAPPGGLQWFAPQDIVARVGSPVLRDAATLSALAVAARSELVPEWSAAPLVGDSAAERGATDETSRLTFERAAGAHASRQDPDVARPRRTSSSTVSCPRSSSTRACSRSRRIRRRRSSPGSVSSRSSAPTSISSSWSKSAP